MSKKSGVKNKQNHLSNALEGFKSALIMIFMISGVVNVLALTGAFYMLQIYDRALTSQSVPTLIALSVLAITLYLFQGVLDVTRSQVLVRLGTQLDVRLAPLAHKVTIDMPRYGYSTTEAMERGRDVDTLRHFMSGQGPIALFDLPWMPLYIAFIYFLHPWLGVLVIAGALVLAGLTLLTELMTRSVSATTQQAAMTRLAIADSNARNADILKAMGIVGRAVKRFENANSEHLHLQMKANNIGGTLSGISKVLRMLLQSAVLGLGAYLTISGEMTAGAIIAASVAASRALAPVDLAIGQWKNVVSSRRSYKRVGDTLAAISSEVILVSLPKPTKSLQVEKVTVATPSSGTVVLSEVSFELSAGQVVGLIGPSGSGKSSLAKALTGIWPLVRGHVRLDAADILQWDSDTLGQHIGYLPQDVALMDGTIAENISRFEDEPEGQQIIAAAQAAGVHEMIVRLPGGYQTPLGPHGLALSAGQRQRVALARALYKDPFVVVLDEPNSNLDAEGDAALNQAITSVRKRGGVAVVIAHRPSALASVDMIGVIQNGRLTAFGTKDEIFKDQKRPVAVPAAAGSNATSLNAASPNAASKDAERGGGEKWVQQAI